MPNINLIKTSISDACRYARNNDPRVVQSVGNFIREGKKIPQASLMYQTDALKESNKYIFENSESPIKALKTVLTSIKNIAKACKSPENKTDVKEFNKEFKELYPKTARKRKKIMKRQAES